MAKCPARGSMFPTQGETAFVLCSCISCSRPATCTRMFSAKSSSSLQMSGAKTRKNCRNVQQHAALVSQLVFRSEAWQDYPGDRRIVPPKSQTFQIPQTVRCCRGFSSQRVSRAENAAECHMLGVIVFGQAGVVLGHCPREVRCKATRGRTEPALTELAASGAAFCKWSKLHHKEHDILHRPFLKTGASCWRRSTGSICCGPQKPKGLSLSSECESCAEAENQV